VGRDADINCDVIPAFIAGIQCDAAPAAIPARLSISRQAIFLLAFYDHGAVVSDAYSDFDMGFALAFIDWQSGTNR